MLQPLFNLLACLNGARATERWRPYHYLTKVKRHDLEGDLSGTTRIQCMPIVVVLPVTDDVA